MIKIQKTIAFCLVSCLAGRPCSAADDFSWSNQRDGRLASPFVVLQIDLGLVEFSVIATSRARRSGTGIPTLITIGQDIAQKLRPPKNAAWALVSGGFGSEDPFEPSGLLVENGLNISPLSGNANNGGIRGAGILCIERAGSPHIIHVDRYQKYPQNCQWAIEAGPIVVDRLVEKLELPSSGRFNRLVACQSKIKWDKFEFYFFQSATLSDVEQILRPRCDMALNLTGDAQAGITFWKENTMKQTIGNERSPLASMILVHRRQY